MSLGAFIAGRYSATQASASLGITEGGWDLVFAPQFERIEESDAWGLSLIELCYRGVRAQIIGRSLEYGAAGILGATWPWGSYGTLGTIGRMAVISSLTGALVLTVTSGTPAVGNPNTLTASRTIITEDSITMAKNSKLRRVPLAFHCIISDSGVLWTTT